MICRALDAGVPAAWVTGDEVYGANPGLRAELEDRGIGYVLAVACAHRVRSGRHPARRRPGQEGAGAGLAEGVAGRGAKGHRFYDWAVIR